MYVYVPICLLLDFSIRHVAFQVLILDQH